MKVERILFPTDFSDGSANALTYAVDLAKHYNAKLYVLHVVYDIQRAAGLNIPHISSDELYNGLNDWAVKELEKSCIEETRSLSGVEKVVVQGIPYEEIINFVTKEEIDMVVIGTYGRSGLDRFIFGSTAERVVRRAPCAVLTVRPPAHRK